jgi:hypothetical protein
MVFAADGPSHAALLSATIRQRDTPTTSVPFPPPSVSGLPNHVGCHARRSMRPRICRKSVGVKWLSASWRMKYRAYRTRRPRAVDRHRRKRRRRLPALLDTALRCRFRSWPRWAESDSKQDGPYDLSACVRVLPRRYGLSSSVRPPSTILARYPTRPIVSRATGAWPCSRSRRSPAPRFCHLWRCCG